MAAGTRSKVSDDAITRLTTNQTTLTNSQTLMASKIDDILVKLSSLEPPSQSSTSGSSSHISNKPHRMKLDVPRFNGTNVVGWMFKINQFFEYHDTPESERLTIASFYMEGPALGWFQWMSKKILISSWTSFLQALEARFEPSEYDDRKGALFKLTQKGSVHDYLTKFKTLANCIVGLAP